MTKYYRVLKETPIWEKGAIVSNGDGDENYRPIEDIWDKLEESDGSRYYELPDIVETSKDFFQRVYKSAGEKFVFKSLATIRKFYSKKFKD